MDSTYRTKTELLDKILSKAVEERQFAGVTLLWEKDGKEVAYLEKGYADLEQKRPMRRDTIFHLYSQSKPVTSAAAMLLLQDGAIDLYDPVAKYFPSYAHQMVQTPMGLVPALHPMTIRDLLNMTSGLVYPAGRTQAETDTARLFDEVLERLGTPEAMTTEQFADRLGSCALQFDPGTDWQYGTSADVCGAIVEKVSGMRYGDFLRKRLFEPLGMKDTAFCVPEDKKDRLAAAYIYHSPEEVIEGAKKAASGNYGKGQEVSQDPAEGGAWLERYTGNNLGIRNDGGENPLEFGGAGLFSTLDDYMAFGRMLLAGGQSREGEQILRPGTIQFMTTHQLEDAQQNSFRNWIGLDGHSYGNFLRVMQDQRKGGIIGHNGEYGWDGWLGTYFCNDPSENQTLLMMVQRYDYGTGTVTRQVHNVVFS